MRSALSRLLSRLRPSKEDRGRRAAVTAEKRAARAEAESKRHSNFTGGTSGGVGPG